MVWVPGLNLWRGFRDRRQNEADSLDDLAAVERTFAQQLRAFDTRADVTAVEKQHRRLHTHNSQSPT